jgi:hypothetical protein
MYEYHFHAVGTKKCHTPKPIEALLPIVTKILTSKLKVTPPGSVSQAPGGSDEPQDEDGRTYHFGGSLPADPVSVSIHPTGESE